MSSAKRSGSKAVIWKYFEDLDDGKNARCKICLSKGHEVKYKLSGGSTKSLRSHLESKHKTEWQDLKDEETTKKEGNDQKNPKLLPGQTTLKDILAKPAKVDPVGPLQQKFDRLLLELIGTNFLAFSFIDSPEFHAFVEFLNKNFNIKAAATYRRQMSKYAKDLFAEVLQLLTDFCDVGMAATTDIWSSRCQDSYISLTTHFVDRHFRLHRFLYQHLMNSTYPNLNHHYHHHHQHLCLKMQKQSGGLQLASRSTSSTQGRQSARCWTSWCRRS